MTELESARLGRTSPLLRRAIKGESIKPHAAMKSFAKGHIVIPKNRIHSLSKPCAIGEGLKTKINANIGTSKDSSSISHELKKLKIAVEYGADAIMDLSTGPNLDKTRQVILATSPIPVGTVPIYEIVINGLKKYGRIKDINIQDIMDVLERQAKQGVDFFTIHAGVTWQVLDILRCNPRTLGIVSRGGAFLAKWMTENCKENPFYQYFDEIVDLAKRYDVTLSLGDGLRPGALADATDCPQIIELATLGKLQQRAFKKGVQAMIEGPGHVPINEIQANVYLEKALCHKAPFYVLGPLVTDVAPGYDHITSAIGGAIAASAGADFLCYVTPAEHLRLPTLEDVKEGVVASKIAAHAADVAKGIKGAINWDIKISKARAERNWKKQFKLALDKEKPRKYRATSKPGLKDVCTMCGEYCSIKMSEKCFSRKK